MHAADKGHKDVFDLLVSEGSDITLTDNNDNTLLHLASTSGNTHIVDQLLPLLDINIRGQEGSTPVMCAADKGQKDVFDLLVSNGADLTLKNNNGNNVLHLASQGGNIQIVDQLLPLFDINVEGQEGFTPVMRAAYEGQKNIFDLLVAKGADLTLHNNGNNVLCLASVRGNTNIVDYLLPLFDINVRGENGFTPVMRAVSKGQRGVFDLLVSKGANLILKGDNGDTILHLACLGGNCYIVNQLLLWFDINVRCRRGSTLAMHAVQNGQKDVCDLLVSKGAYLPLQSNDVLNMREAEVAIPM